MFALVCLDWNGHEVYTSFHTRKEDAIIEAERLPAVIRVEVAHAKQQPIWVRKLLDTEPESM
jgi:hypothetical protein